MSKASQLLDDLGQLLKDIHFVGLVVGEDVHLDFVGELFGQEENRRLLLGLGGSDDRILTEVRLFFLQVELNEGELADLHSTLHGEFPESLLVLDLVEVNEVLEQNVHV